MENKRCASCRHYGQDFPSWHMDYCNREDSGHYADLMNREDGCKAWEQRAECGGCAHWDGDDGRCRNANSVHFMNETDNGCEVWEEK